MVNSWLVLLPPIIVITLSFITRKVVPSLLAGIILAALIVADFAPVKTLWIVLNRFWDQIERQNLYTFGFLILLGALITIMSHTGGTAAYGRMIRKRLKNKKTAETASLGLSLIFAIDDFFSILTVGSIMKPVTDSFKIPRVKLAYLIDSLAAPLVILVPVSTWVAMLLMQLAKAGISLNAADQPLVLADPFPVYLQIIPFTFYSFITFINVLCVVRFGISFGPMQKQEIIADKSGNLFGGKEPTASMAVPDGSKGSLLHFILPLASLIISVAIALLYLGNSWLLGGSNGLLQTMQQADIFLALFIGAAVALLFTLLLFLLQKSITLKDLPTIFKGGFDLMKDSLIILFLAWTFSALLKNDLQTGNYIAQLLLGSLPLWLLPAILFITAFITATGTGSSWGTIAVLVPLAVPMVTTLTHSITPTDLMQLPILLPVLGAIFAGAVAGDHLSPIGTTTVMTAVSTGAYLQDHVITQLPYALPALCATIISYLLAGRLIESYGLWSTAAVSLNTGIALSLIVLFIVNRLTKK